ncbi:MAG: tRNA (adenosine(37)-N6)-threonylcarbamoyltransferase complex ATPase subunit type 1 TsaE [Edaphocola sp.]
MQISYTLATIDAAAARFWQIARHHKLILFNGGLGAGKTTFTAALCRHLGVEDTVGSPTFSIINEYHFKDKAGQDKTIYHADLYRLANEDEAANAGVEDILQPANGWCILEWAERAKGLLPRHYLEADFVLTGDDMRTLALNMR